MLKEKWFGKQCRYQCCQFENEDDKSQPELVFCNHMNNTEDTEGNCNIKLCPLNSERIENKLITLVKEYKDIYLSQSLQDCKDDNFSEDSVEDFINQNGINEELKLLVIQLGNIKKEELLK